MKLQTPSLSLLTVCRKAGRLVLGFDAVCDAAKSGKAVCLLTASDASPKTRKELLFRCKLPCYTLDADCETLEHMLGRRTAVLAVCDAGFAHRFETLLAQTEPKQPV